MSGSLTLAPFANTVLGIVAGVVYTQPAGTVGIIRALTLDNVSNAAVTATVQIVKSGGGGTYNLVTQVPLAAYGSYVCREALNQVLAAGDEIQALASAAAAVHLVASGAHT